jgi:hypothetical protein
MIVLLKNAAPPRRTLFDPNTAHFNLKNFIFAFFALFSNFHFFKTKKLTTLLDWYDIIVILSNFSTPYLV